MVSGAEATVRTLEAHDVEYVFGVCGDTSVGLYHAFETLDHDIRHVLARDERSAAYMADAYARLSDRPGVCEGPSGGGATYILPGLAEANGSSVPVVALNTNVPVRYRNRGVLTELPQGELFDHVTKWNAVADHPDLISRLLRRAFREATTGRPGATHVSLPIDVLDGETDEPIYADGDATTAPAHRPPPEPDRVDRAVTILTESERPAFVVGGGIHASGAWAAVRQLAEHIGAPVATTLTGAGCLGDSDYSVGVVGENGSREYANEVIREADVLFLLGTAVESVWTGKWSQPRDLEKTIVHVDVDPGTIGLNYATELAVPGDLRETTTRLLEAVEPATKWEPSELRERHAEWLAGFEAGLSSGEFPIRPERMVAGAESVLDDDAVIVSDPGTSCPYFAALYDFPEPGCHWITPRAHGALGYAIPGVIGAALACPDAQVIGFTGDGSVGISAGELETLARLDLPVTIVVVNNGAFSWIEAGQRNYADFSFGVDFDDLNYARIAEEFGLSGYRVESASEYESTLERAVDEDGPSLVDLPTRPLPTLQDAPVDWLDPRD